MRSKFRRWGLSALTMVSVATVVLLVTGWGSAVAASVQSVIVANTANNPVPVSVGSLHTDTNGNLKVAEQGTPTVHVDNTDGNGNVKVHEQGTANVNVTNNSLAVTSSDHTQIIASGENVVQPLIPLGPPNSADLVGSIASPVDVSAYKTVTFYWAISGNVVTSSERYDPFTKSNTALFDPWCGAAGCVPPAAPSGAQTFDPAPPNLVIRWSNDDTSNSATIDWMLVGRSN